MPAEGSGRSGREGLALLRTAISREWLVLIALISRAEAKPAVHRPCLAPRGPGGRGTKGVAAKPSRLPLVLEGLAASEGSQGAQRLPCAQSPLMPPVEPAHF